MRRKRKKNNGWNCYRNISGDKKEKLKKYVKSHY